MQYKDSMLIVEDCRTRWENFEGAETKFSPAGIRFFFVNVTQEIGEALMNDGWKVQKDEDGLWWAKIRVNAVMFPGLLNVSGMTIYVHGAWWEYGNFNRSGKIGYLQHVEYKYIPPTFYDIENDPEGLIQ